MGYTHFLTQKRDLTDDEWTQLRVAAHQIFYTARAQGIQLAGPLGEIEDGIMISDDTISFNGLAGEAHETCTVERYMPDDPDLYSDGGGFFSFCKTARKPYDAAVIAILRAAKDAAPDAFTISSDEDPSVFANPPLYPKPIRPWNPDEEHDDGDE